MPRSGKYILAGVISYVVLAVCVVAFHDRIGAYFSYISAEAKSAAVFFVQSITVEQLHLTYASGSQTNASTANAPATPTPTPTAQKVKVLIVPGHEPDSGGTQFGDYTERDIVVDIANDLAALLESNPHFDVTVARTKTSWNPILEQYFTQNWDAISAFRDQQSALMNQYIASGKIIPENNGEQVDHKAAPTDTAIRLYGINKWASENNIQITLHLHINDYAGRSGGDIGNYTGFAIYVPNYQYSNAEASKALALPIAYRLSAYHATSSMPLETPGVIEEQQLIAIGSNNSADAASMLIEYGYIYERQFQDPATRAFAENEYAYQTYLGIQDFFNDPVHTYFGTNVLPKVVATDLTPKTTSPDIYALQEALHYKGLYPIATQNFNDCPISGYFGDCTKTALSAFQTESGLPQTGLFDTQTAAAIQSVLAGVLQFQQ